MQRGDIVFYAGDSLADALIIGGEAFLERAARTIGKKSYWSHVAIAKGDGSAVCAWAGGGGMQSGVMDGFLDHYQNPKPGQITTSVTPPHVTGDLYADAQKYLGRPYDFLGLAADPLWDMLKLKIPGGPPEAFVCSSLVGYLLLPYGYNWGVKPIRALTPDDIFDAVATPLSTH